MTKTDMGNVHTAQPANDIAWRHFWLANVMVDTNGGPLVRAARPALLPRKDSLSRRLKRLHHMRAILGDPQP